MNAYDILGYQSPDGDIVCYRCAERDDEHLDSFNAYKRVRDEGYSVIFINDEWDSYPSCDTCHDELDDVALTTNGRDWLGRRSIDSSLHELWDEYKAVLPKFVDATGQMLYYDNTGDEFCGDCATEEAKEGVNIVGGRPYEEGPTIFCCRCNNEIESAYGDPDAEHEYDPEAGDISTGDFVQFWQYGKLIVSVNAPSIDWKQAVKKHMESDKFWPNVFFISDHGNVSLIPLE